MNSKFPLLKLPLFGFEAVTVNLEISDLIHLAFTSNRLKRLIIALRLKMNKFIFIVRSTHTAIQFNYKSPNARGGWSFDTIEFPSRHPVTALIGGMEVRSFIEENWLYSDITGNIQENVKVQMNYLKELIRFPAPDVDICSDDLSDWNQPLSFGFNECHDLRIKGKDKLKEETLSNVFRLCTVKNSIYMNVPMNSTFTHDLSQWKLPKAIYIKKSAHWITNDVLHQSECSHMMFIECNLTARDFLEFVERWINSDETNFEYLHLSWKNGVPQDLNLDNLGIELRKFNPTRRHRNFLYIEGYALNMSTGRDLVRKDGILASIMTTRDSVVFCVFHQRFPNLEGVKTVKV